MRKLWLSTAASGVILAMAPAVAAAAAAVTTIASFTGAANSVSPGALTVIGAAYYGEVITTDDMGNVTLSVVSVGKTGIEKSVCSFSLGTGSNVVSPMLNVGGTLYGEASTGGSYGPAGPGFVFACNPKAKTGRLIYSFLGNSDGAAPAGGLSTYNGLLYGTTAIAGANATGTLFSVDPTSGTETVIYSFPAADGSGSAYNGHPVIERGTLYGEHPGGSNGAGYVYKVNLATNAVALLYNFTGTVQGSGDGAYPVGGMTYDGGALYGITLQGGGAYCGCGTVFRIVTATGVQEIIHSFNGMQGGEGMPSYGDAAPLVANGLLYGTTAQGGVGYGVAYTLSPTTEMETLVQVFSGGSDGGSPSPLAKSGSTYYGTTATGGAHGAGTLFKLTQ